MEGNNQTERDRETDGSIGGFSIENDLSLKNGQKTVRARGERVVSIFVVITLFAAVIVVYVSLININKPDWLNKKRTVSQFCADGSCNLDEDADDLELQNTDTDGDGLSDYQELKIYGSSPYLQDSDSDGTDDKAEVEQGTDPNCSGSACVDIERQSSGETPLFSQGPDAVNQVNPDELRGVLSENGLSQEMIDSFSDSDLISIYNQLLAGETMDDVVENTTNNQSQDNIDSIDDLRGLSGTQIRALLLQQGMPQNMIDSIDDAQLRLMFLDQLDSQLNNTPSNN